MICETCSEKIMPLILGSNDYFIHQKTGLGSCSVCPRCGGLLTPMEESWTPELDVSCRNCDGKVYRVGDEVERPDGDWVTIAKGMAQGAPRSLRLMPSERFYVDLFEAHKSQVEGV
jgi:hypothetical protein